MKSIGRNIFSYCRKLTTISIPASLNTISLSMFNSCDGLSSVSIPDNISSIEAFAFTDCKNLSSLTLPKNLKKIQDWAFKGCDNISVVTFLNATPPEVPTEYDPMIFDNYDVTLQVPKGSKEAYQNHFYWINFKNIKEIE